MEERLESVKKRIQRVKEVLRITPRTPLGTITMVQRLLDSFERSEQRGMVSESHSSLFTSPSIPLTSSHHSCDATTQTDVFGYEVLPYVLCHGENTTGCFDIHTPSTPDENYFISSIDAMRNLFGTVSKYNRKCPLCGFVFDMQLFSFQRHGHAVRISLNCAAGHSLRWYSNCYCGKVHCQPEVIIFFISVFDLCRNIMPRAVWKNFVLSLLIIVVG